MPFDWRFNRNDLNTMLLSIIYPSAEIREGYNSYLVITTNGRVVTGTLAEQDPETVTLHTPEGASVSILVFSRRVILP